MNALESITAGGWQFLEADTHEEDWNHCRPLTISDANNNDLCTIYSCEDATVGQSRAEAVASAYLIAAAPDLLNALKAIVECSNEETIAQAKAALAKAVA